jgi:hypothetical protein
VAPPAVTAEAAAPAAGELMQFAFESPRLEAALRSIAASSNAVGAVGTAGALGAAPEALQQLATARFEPAPEAGATASRKRTGDATLGVAGPSLSSPHVRELGIGPASGTSVAHESAGGPDGAIPEHRQERQAAVDAAIGRMTLQRGAHAEVDVPQLGRVSVDVRTRDAGGGGGGVGAGALDVTLQAARPEAVRALAAARPALDAELRAGAIEVGHWTVRAQAPASSASSGSSGTWSGSASGGGGTGANAGNPGDPRAPRDEWGDGAASSTLEPGASGARRGGGGRVRIVL